MSHKTRLPRTLNRRQALATMGTLLGASALSGTFVGRSFAAEGQTLTWAVHLSPTNLFFDPGITPGTGAPLMIQYALHDALIRPVRGEATALSLAESMDTADDGLSYTFVLREGLKFQNGDPLTAEDAKFSFDRYKGANAELIREFVREAEVIDDRTIRYHLSEPWPDFLTIFGTPASGVAWVVPKAYIESIGEDEFKNAPIGAGPYRLKSFKPGTEIEFEASEHYWRKTPEVPHLLLRMIPDAATRLAAITNGEVDFAYGIQGDLVREAQANPDLRVESAALAVSNFAIFASQYDTDSPWSDARVRQAANLALDRASMNEVAYAGLARVSSSIIPHVMDFYWAPPEIAYDPEAAKALLAEAGYPDGFDGGEIYASSDDELAEFVQANLAAVGINMRLNTAERASQLQRVMDKKLTGIVMTGSGAPGNAAIRLQQFVDSEGSMSYIHDDELDAAIEAQARILDPVERAAKLDAIQKQLFDENTFMPIIEFSFPVVIGPRVDYDGVNGIPGSPYTTPYEDLTIKS